MISLRLQNFHLQQRTFLYMWVCRSFLLEENLEKICIKKGVSSLEITKSRKKQKTKEMCKYFVKKFYRNHEKKMKKERNKKKREIYEYEQ